MTSTTPVAVSPQDGKATRKGVAVFLAISFGLAWVWLLVATAVLDLSAIDPLVQLPAVCAPAFAAFVVRRWVTREGFGDAGLRLNLRAAWRYYLAAWLGPAALAVCTLALAAAIGMWSPDLSGPGGVLPGAGELLALLALMVVALVMTPLYCGEEFGWTSYLRPRLFGGRPLPSTVATGLIWAVWHFPLAFIGYVEFEVVVVGLAVWTVSFQLQEVILTWLYTRSGTVWTASLAHAGNNMVLFFVLGELLEGRAGLGATWPMALSLAPMTAVALWVAATRKLAPTTP